MLGFGTAIAYRRAGLNRASWWCVGISLGDNPVGENRKATVSLCMIVRNEGHQLAECLTPVADLFDEIVIVDTGSTDQTVRIARQFTPHVHHFPWCDDFAAARNASLQHATGDRSEERRVGKECRL